jgi:hypothetical protein
VKARSNFDFNYVAVAQVEVTTWVQHKWYSDVEFISGNLSSIMLLPSKQRSILGYAKGVITLTTNSLYETWTKACRSHNSESLCLDSK